MFQAPKLTNAGKALYYENMAGAPLIFTTIKLGSGTLTGPIATMTNLVNTVVTIDAAATANDGYADVAGAFSNAELTAGFYWREIGVFAQNQNYPNDRTKDILYCYQNAFDTADYIPMASVETVEKSITVPVIVGNATAVSCTLSKSQIYVTADKLDAAISRIVQVGGEEPAAGPCIWFDTSGLAPNTVSASLELGGPGDTAELMAQVDSTDFPVENAKTGGTPKAGEYSFDII